MKGAHDKPDLRITTDIYTFTVMAAGKVNGTTAYLSGRLTADGSIDDLLKLGSIFP